MNNQLVSFMTLGDMGMTMVLAVGLGVLQLLFGFRFRKLWITLQGFLFGFIAGGFLGGALGDSLFTVLLLPLLLAVLMAFVAYRFFKVGVFIACFGAVCLMYGMLSLFPHSGGNAGGWWMAMALGVVAGMLGVTLTKPVFIILTAIAGGSSLGNIVGRLTGISWLGALLALVLIGTGIWYQIKNTGGLFEKKRTHKAKATGQNMETGREDEQQKKETE